MSTLAKSMPGELASALERIGTVPSYAVLRDPEPGLVMVRARAGGTGMLFNLGEMTVTRATVELRHEGRSVLGLGYVCGRSRRHAELAALCDALLQTPEWHGRIATQVVAVLEKAAQERREERLRRVQPTKVEFFTVVRGESA
jgi:alpha-D-ribose 1-methylphosphonate 5-triphosphate synthase subunit PhnG